jgi:hypothetical protein
MLLVCDHTKETIPGSENHGVGKFKKKTLAWIQDGLKPHPGGFHWVAGYGNASTDVAAYKHVGMTGESVFIMGAKAEKSLANAMQDAGSSGSCNGPYVALGVSFSDHVSSLRVALESTLPSTTY